MEPENYSLDDVEQVDEPTDTTDADQSGLSPKGSSGFSLGLSKRQLLVIGLVVVVVVVLVARRRRGGSSSSSSKTTEQDEPEPEPEPIHIPDDADQSEKDAAALDALKEGGHMTSGAGE